MNKMKSVSVLLTGMLLGTALSGPAAQAAESLQATLSHHRILVDGQEARMEAYTIRGENYVRLRDIGQAVGFEVFWDSDLGCVRVESGKPYTGQLPASEPMSEETSSTVTAQDTEVLKREIVERTNAIREDNDLPALTVNEMLTQAAQVRAEEMAASGIYSHTRPDGSKFNTVTDCGTMGENIHRLADWSLQGKSVAEVAVWSWSKSDGHLKNMTKPENAEIGVGLARGTDKDGNACWYCVQLFLRNGYTIRWVDSPAASR